MENKGMFTSNSSEWETPQDLFDELDKKFQFDLDVCASHENAKCAQYLTKETDALRLDVYWIGTCWMNPPYGREIGIWIAKAYSESRLNNSTVVCLLPARTDTRWWHDYVMKAFEVRFIKGRLHFSNSKVGAPFPSAIVVFRGSPGWPCFYSADKLGRII